MNCLSTTIYLRMWTERLWFHCRASSNPMRCQHCWKESTQTKNLFYYNPISSRLIKYQTAIQSLPLLSSWSTHKRSGKRCSLRSTKLRQWSSKTACLSKAVCASKTASTSQPCSLSASIATTTTCPCSSRRSEKYTRSALISTKSWT